MKFKTISILPYIFALIAVSTSCMEEPVGYHEHDNDGELQMSAIVNTDNEFSSVSIRRVRKFITVPVEDATVDVVVNGETRQTITAADSMYYSGRYYFRPDFSAGDKVEIIAHVGDQTLTSSSECLQPLEILSVDTIPLTITYSEHYSDDIYRLHIKVRKSQGSKRNGFYRLDVRHKMTQVSWHELVYDYDTGDTYWKDHYFSYEDTHYTYKNDVALNNGNVDTGDESLIQFMDQTPNRYGVFTDDFFDGDTYTLVVDVPRTLSWEDELKCVVSTITPDEYNYLRSVCSISDDSEISDGAPVLKTNVSGGMGFVGVESAATFTLRWANHYIPDSYYY